MKWPFVFRSTFENEREGRRAQMIDLRVAQAQRDAWETRSDAIADSYNALLDKYHELRMKGAEAPLPVPAIVEIDQPEQPPPLVLAAMQQISPVPDKTYEANWQHWERNKARAAAYPKDFAAEIIMGAVFATDDIVTH